MYDTTSSPRALLARTTQPHSSLAHPPSAPYPHHISHPHLPPDHPPLGRGRSDLSGASPQKKLYELLKALKVGDIVGMRKLFAESASKRPVKPEVRKKTTAQREPRAEVEMSQEDLALSLQARAVGAGSPMHILFAVPPSGTTSTLHAFHSACLPLCTSSTLHAFHSACLPLCMPSTLHAFHSACLPPRVQARHRGNAARRQAPKPLYQSSTPLVLTVHQLRLAHELRRDAGLREVQVNMPRNRLPTKP